MNFFKKRFKPAQFIFILVCLYVSGAFFSQELKICPEVSLNSPNRFWKNASFKDEATLKVALASLQQDKVKEGYVFCSIDSIIKHDSCYQLRMYLGPLFPKIAIRFSGESGFVYCETLDEFERIMYREMEKYTTTGYPFAQLKIDSYAEVNGLMQLFVSLDKGKKMKLTAIRNKSDSTLTEQMLLRFTGLQIGDEFSSSELEELTRRLRQFNFLSVQKDPEILFSQDGFELLFYVKENKISTANGLVGIQTNPNSMKTSITGDIHLNLLNDLKHGEQFLFNWKSPQASSQQLNSRFVYPFIGGSSFGTDLLFDLYKKDSSLLETNAKLAAMYSLANRSSLKAYYQVISSNRIEDANPLNADISTRYYGLNYTTRTVDFLPNPTSGHLFTMDVAVGTRKTKVSDTIPQETATAYKMNIEWDIYFPLTKRFITRLNIGAQVLYSGKLYANELLRFGGFNSLRGFNENELNASSLSTMLLEQRCILDKFSYVFVFGNVAMYEQNTISYSKGMPIGLGAGISFNTRTGIFSFAYALGKQSKEVFQFKSAKIHFGYTAYF